MATITASNPVYYRGTTSGVSGMVGYETEGGYARVLRYTFTTPASGASKVSFSTSAYIYEYDGSSKLTLIDWCITSNATSHLGAVTANGAESLGTVSLTYDTDDRYSASGSASVALLPNTTYYLWFFPKTTTYTIWEWQPSTVTLTTTAAVSSVSAPNGYIEKSVNISIVRYSSAFTHTLAYSLDSGSTYATIASSIGTSYTWTIPSSAYDSLGSTDTSISCRIRCRTYNGSTLIGTSYCTISLMVDSTLNAPAVSATWSVSPDISSLTGSPTKVVLNYHTLSATVTGTAKNGATISSYFLTHGDATLKKSSGSFTAETSTLKYGVTDSRGLIGTGSKSLGTVAYIKPTLRFSAVPPDSQTGETIVKATGQWFNGSFGASSNTLTVQYRYKVSGGTYGSWTAATLTRSGNTYTGTATLTLDYTKKYVFQMRVTDALQTVTSAAYTVSTIPVFDWSDADFAFHVPVTINGKDVLVTGSRGLGGISYGRAGVDFTDATGLDELTVNSFWSYHNADTPLASADANTKYVYGITLAYSVYNIAQIGFCCDTSTKIVRQMRNGTWGEWRFENPPMSAGVEYPTTERTRGGLVVYRKRITYTNTAAFGATGTTTTLTVPHGITSYGVLVRIVSKVNAVPLPYMGNGQRHTLVGNIDSSNITVRTNDAWSANLTWDFDIAYTKS